MTTADHSHNCPTWCTGCDPVEDVHHHRATLHTARRDSGACIAAVSLSRVDDLAANLEGPTTVDLTTCDDLGHTLTADQARALSDAFDFGARAAYAAHDSTCQDCARPWPLAGLIDGRCVHCDRTTRRLRLVGSPEPDAPSPLAPHRDEPPGRIARCTIRARYGDTTTNVEVTHHSAAPNGDPPTDLVRVRLGSDGYLTAAGARRLAANLERAATTLDALTAPPRATPHDQPRAARCCESVRTLCHRVGMSRPRPTESAANQRCYTSSGAGVGAPLTVADADLLTHVLAAYHRAGEWEMVQIIARALDLLGRDIASDLPEDLARALSAWADLADHATREPSLPWTTHTHRRRVLRQVAGDSPAAAALVRRLFAHLASWTARHACGPRRIPETDDLGSLTRRARRCRLEMAALDRADRRAALAAMRDHGPRTGNRAERRALIFGHSPEPTAPVWDRVEPLPPPDPRSQPRAAQAPPRTAWAPAA